MPRLPVPSDSEAFSEGTREAVRHILGTRGGAIPAPSGLLTYAGQTGALFSDLTSHLRYHTSLSDAETELAIMMAARAANNDYIWNAHARLGLQAGVPEATVQTVDCHGPLDGLTDDESTIVRLGRELLEQPAVSQPTFDAVVKRYGEKGLMELVALMGLYTMTACVLRVVEMELPAGGRKLT